MKNFISFLLLCQLFQMNILYAQNVGIGTNTPIAKLDVSGNLRVATEASIGNSLLVGGTGFGNYKLQVNDGSLAVYNTLDQKYWTLTYNSLDNYFAITEAGTARVVMANGGNVGIGTYTPDYKLDVEGAIRASGNIQSLGILSVSGAATVNGGGGVAYNPNSSTNLKIVPFTTANFHAVLSAHGSAETSIGLPAGFTSTPRVFVGNINVTGGTAGELNRVILVLWNCDTNSCTAKIINTDNAAVDYNITWNCLAVGN
jgi:hypothetical protein